jgi:hypothetical protein
MTVSTNSIAAPREGEGRVVMRIFSTCGRRRRIAALRPRVSPTQATRLARPVMHAAASRRLNELRCPALRAGWNENRDGYSLGWLGRHSGGLSLCR